MTQTRNPWVRPPLDDSVTGETNPSKGHRVRRVERSAPDADPLPRDQSHKPPAATGPLGPQQPVPPTEALPRRVATRNGALWIVGAHGGAGETTLASWGDDEWVAADHAWPAAPRPCPTVLVARTSVRGLLAAQAALTQWAGGGAGESVALLGLVLVEDAPGRPPRAIRDLMRHVEGGAPRAWRLPWSEAVRLNSPNGLRSSRAFPRLVNDLRSLVSAAEPATDQHN